LWREEAGFRVFHFPIWAKARAMQHWIESQRHCPAPDAEGRRDTRAEQQREALAWGLNTGAARAIVQAYRQARQRGESELTAFNVAAEVALALGRPLDRVNDTARTDRLGSEGHA